MNSGVSRNVLKRGERNFGGKEGAKRTNWHVNYQSQGGNKCRGCPPSPSPPINTALMKVIGPEQEFQGIHLSPQKH